MPTSSAIQRPDSASQRRRSSLTNNSASSPRRSSITESAVSPRRSSITDKKGLRQADRNLTAPVPRHLRRSSSNSDIEKENNEIPKFKKPIIDGNQNNLTPKHTRNSNRRRSSTSGALLITKDGLTSPRSPTDETPSRNGTRRSSVSTAPNSPRRGSMTNAILSPRWKGALSNASRRNSSTSNHFLSPEERLGATFKYPEARSKSFEYTDANVVVGSLVMSSNASIRALEFGNEMEDKEKGEIETKLAKMEEDRKHLEVLEAAIVEWNGVLKNIQRLSKGVPLMRSIRLVCLQMYKVFVENGGKYGASILALRRSKLPIVTQISTEMENLRAKIEEGGQELSLVDGKFLEEVREILGILKGIVAITLEYYR